MNLIRNYAYDEPAMFRDIYIAICEGFDELQKDSNGVDKQEMIKFVMKKTKGNCNPQLLNTILERFEK